MCGTSRSHRSWITVAYVSQDNFLFHLSVKENIRMGKSGATDEEIVKRRKAGELP